MRKDTIVNMKCLTEKKYIAYFLFSFLILFCLAGCEKKQKDMSVDDQLWADMKPDHSLELQYAEQFSVDYYENGYIMITIGETDRYLLVADQADVPEELDSDIVVIRQTPQHIYLAATSAMDLIRAVGGMDQIAFSGLKMEDWYIDAAREAMQNGDILYAGKYSAPDMELLLDNDCDLAIESTMILHTPEIKEQMEKLGIPVLVERSSYESHPLGRMEWIKLYGVLLGCSEEAEAYFDSQAEQVQGLAGKQDGDENSQSVAFFYVTANGAVNIRKSNDYVAKMIELAGGKYVFEDLASEDENALSTMNIQMEEFYKQAKDADILIYNSTIDGELFTLDELYDKNELFRDFKAVQNGNVFCTGKNMFQQTTGFGDMIMDIHKILVDPGIGDAELIYLHRLQ